MRKTLAACLLLMIATLANGFQTTTEWVKYTSVEGRYSALVPKQPKLKTQEATAAAGEKLTQYLAQAMDSDSLYSVNYFDTLPGMLFSLDKGRDGAVASVKGILLSSEAISLGGSPGLEFKTSLKSADQDFLAVTRIYNFGGRIYFLQHLFLKSTGSSAMAAKTVKFFDSFKVVTSK
jgi:hypothetical protein